MDASTCVRDLENSRRWRWARQTSIFASAMSPTPVFVQMLLAFVGIMGATRAQRKQRADDKKQH